MTSVWHNRQSPDRRATDVGCKLAIFASPVLVGDPPYVRRQNAPLAWTPPLPPSGLDAGAACAFLLAAGCNFPMSKLAENGPPAPGPLSSGFTPCLYLAPDNSTSDTRSPTTTTGSDSVVRHTVYHSGGGGGSLAPNEVVVDLDAVLRLACEHNPRILLAREQVNESQAAFDAAVQSCMPQLLRKDAFKRPIAEAQLWRRRAELSKVQYEVLEDAADTYFDWLTARRGVAIAEDLQTYEQKLRKRSQALVDSGEKTAQVLVEAVQTFVNIRRQFIARTHQLGDAAATKLAYLLGMSDSLPIPSVDALAPNDIVDAGVPVESLVQQAQENGPGVRELQGLAAAIQTGINDAQSAPAPLQSDGRRDDLRAFARGG